MKRNEWLFVLGIFLFLIISTLAACGMSDSGGGGGTGLAKGTVLVAGQPVAGATVTLGPYRTTTNAVGYYEIGGIAYGNYTMTVTLPDGRFRSEPVSFSKNGNVNTGTWGF